MVQSMACSEAFLRKSVFFSMQIIFLYVVSVRLKLGFAKI